MCGPLSNHGELESTRQTFQYSLRCGYCSGQPFIHMPHESPLCKSEQLFPSRMKSSKNIHNTHVPRGGPQRMKTKVDTSFSGGGGVSSRVGSMPGADRQAGMQGSSSSPTSLHLTKQKHSPRWFLLLQLPLLSPSSALQHDGVQIG